MPKYSVLIPIYNAEKYLAECFDSVLNQTYTDFEVIAVDDGSTDGSREICDSYAKKDSRIKVICKENGGVNRARRTAFENSSGKYILTVDCDDVVDRELIETVDRAIEKYNCDLVLFDLLHFDAQNNITVKKMTDKEMTFDEKNRKELYMLLLNRRMNSLCTKCCLREYYSRAFVYEKFQPMCRGEDWFCSAVQVHEMKKCRYIQKPLYRYRRVSESLSCKYDIESFRLNSDSLNEVRRMMELDGCFDSEAEAAWKAYARMVANTFLLALNALKITTKEKIDILKTISDTDIYKISVGRGADVNSTRLTKLKFCLLKFKMYRILFRLMRFRET